MNQLKFILQIIGYAGFGCFFIQILNLYIELFKPSSKLIYATLLGSIVPLFILALVDRMTNKEDKYYSKTVEK
mgnify:FL=1